jgi:hypothetical protein
MSQNEAKKAVKETWLLILLLVLVLLTYFGAFSGAVSKTFGR